MEPEVTKEQRCHGHHRPLKMLIGLLLAVLLLTLSVSQIASWKTKFASPNVISVAGEGKSVGIPDVGLISLSVLSEKNTAKEVMQDNSAKMNDIIKFVKDNGVQDKDVQTSGYYLTPRYDFPNGNRVFRGYDLTSTLAVKIRNLDKISDIIDGAVTRGANQVGDIQFIIDDETKLKDEARDKAIAQAKDKAQQIAKGAGLTLGKIVSFSENDGMVYPQPLYMDKGISAGQGGGAAPAVEQGSQEIDINVTLGFELK